MARVRVRVRVSVAYEASLAARHAARRQVVHRTTTALVHAALGLVVDGLE